jgi:hypothetical protein
MQFVYLIGDDGAVLVLLDNGQVIQRLFAPNADDAQALSFVHLLGEYPSAPIYVLIDVMDQSYVRHKLPPVSSLGLNKLVQRRLQRDFGKDDVTGALNLGRDKDGRKDWNFLMISLSVSGELQRWLDLVYELPNYFAGVYMLPVECEKIIPEFAAALRAKHKESEPAVVEDVFSTPVHADGSSETDASSGSKGKKFSPKAFRSTKKSGSSLAVAVEKTSRLKKTSAKAAKGTKSRQAMWQILISHQKVGGFRQVVLREGHLMFTRQTQAMENSPPALIAGSVEQELQNTIEYLRRMSYHPADGMEVFVVIGESIKQQISPANFTDLSMYVMTPFEAAELLGRTAQMQQADRFADIILSAMFGSFKKKCLKLGTPISKRLDGLYKKIKMLRLASACISIGLLGYTGYVAFGWWSGLGELDRMQTQEKKNKQQFDEIKKQSSSLSADVNLITDLIAFNEFVGESFETPIDATDKLAKRLVSNGMVKSFEWVGNNLNLTPLNAMSLDKATRTKPDYAIKFSLEMMYDTQTWDAFLKKSDGYFKTIAEAFSSYDVKYGNLPGSFQQSDVLKIQSDAPTTGPKMGDTFDVTFEITGPKKSDVPVEAAPVVSDD